MTQPCSACSGRGVVSFGTDDLTCVQCGGAGVIKDKPKSKPKTKEA